jgi:hypothetical protein
MLHLAATLCPLTLAIRFAGQAMFVPRPNFAMVRIFVVPHL